jgi:hypothetical protein
MDCSVNVLMNSHKKHVFTHTHSSSNNRDTHIYIANQKQRTHKINRTDTNVVHAVRFTSSANLLEEYTPSSGLAIYTGGGDTARDD